MKKALEIIKKIDESRAAKWKLAVDEDSISLKAPLERLGFKVLSFQSGLSDDEVNELLIKHKIDFFVTKNGQDYKKYLYIPRRPNYKILCVDHAIMADVNRVAKTIEGAILYDTSLDKPTHVNINGHYVTELPKIKKQYQRNH